MAVIMEMMIMMIMAMMMMMIMPMTMMMIMQPLPTVGRPCAKEKG
jgi:hypothetical protein